ncbi:MAG: methyltransferase domain-containing protein [Crocinitomicaceae bacterium]|nr:methyltransferase domain-containing protein [Crocinitomicaceae bacterium]
MENEWFASWFDTSYYHILYKNRDDVEAKKFIHRLVDLLSIPKTKKILDLACGKGRHSVTLNELGYNVLGVDLSKNSIDNAKKSVVDGLDFDVHDMREVIQGKSFGAIFNLFTSFGYFDSTADNNRVLSSIHTMLEPNGILVIDFMNAQRIINSLVESEEKMVDGISFAIKRNYDGTHIFKNIQFSDGGHDYDFTERVQALKAEDFEIMLNANNFEILSTFGDFDLAPYNSETSDRLILVARKQ